MMKGKYAFSWREHPIGFPLDPDDDNFEGKRTPPISALTIQYMDGVGVLRQSVACTGLIEDVDPEVIKNMKKLLLEWLETELEKLNNG